ncbi:MAG: Cna B-type domain-containing protein [Eggerthellaceae bacterium]|nr:Cna B-type domain-containing protein [Eggerthellaceae bacterium]
MNNNVVARSFLFACAAILAAALLVSGAQAFALENVKAQATSEKDSYPANTWAPLAVSINNESAYDITILEAGFKSVPKALEYRTALSTKYDAEPLVVTAGTSAYKTVHEMEVRKVTSSSATPASTTPSKSTVKTADSVHPLLLVLVLFAAAALAVFASRRMKNGGMLSLLLVGVLSVGGLAALPAVNASAASTTETATCQIKLTIDGTAYTFDGYVEYTYVIPDPTPPMPDPVTADITLTKTWDDADNQDVLRPTGDAFAEALTLKADGVAVADVQPQVSTTSGSNTYTVVWSGLPGTNDEGAEITYTIEEAAIDGYTAGEVTGNAEDGFAITNTHVPDVPPTPETIDVTGTKRWVGDGGKKHDNATEVKLTLFRQAGEGEIEEVTGAAPTWEGATYTFTAQPKSDTSGAEYTYYVSEEDVEGYDREYTDADGTPGLDFVPNGGVIVNTLVDETIDISGTKFWRDGGRTHDNASEVALTLYRRASGSVADAEQVAGATPTWDGNTYTFVDQPRYDSNRNAYTYYVTEEQVEGYDAPKYTDKDGVATSTPGAPNGGLITNELTQRMIDVTVDKLWVDAFDQDGKRPNDLTLTLYRTGREGDSLDTGKVNVTPEVTKSGHIWTYTFKDVPAYDSQRYEFIYEVSEESVPEGYTRTYCDGNGNPLLSSATGARNRGIIKNTHTPETTSVTIAKVWEDTNNQDGIRPASITVSLKANGEQAKDMDDNAIGNITLNDANGWKAIIDGLPKYESGTEITYTATEDTVPEGYTASMSGTTVTNKHTPATMVVTLIKTWDDVEDADGIRPAASAYAQYLTLKADGTPVDKAPTITDNNNIYTVTWSGLDKNKAGTAIVYTVEESAITGYTAGAVGGNAADGFTLTNTHVPTVTISGIKTWKSATGNNDDLDTSKIPEKYTVRLEKSTDGTSWTPVSTLEVVSYIAPLPPSPTDPVPPTDKWTFENQPKYENGVELQYRVVEVTVPDGFTMSGGTKDANGEYNITNTYTPSEQETIDVYGTKTWNFGQGLDPEAISYPVKLTVTLQQETSSGWETVSDAEPFEVEYTANDNEFSPGGAGEFDDSTQITDEYRWTVPKYDSNNQLINYRVVENATELAAKGFTQQATSPVRQADDNIEHNLENKFSGASTDSFNISVSMNYENGSWADWWGSQIGWGGIVKGNQEVTITNTETGDVSTLTFTPIKGGGMSAAQTVQLTEGTYTISQTAYTPEGLDAKVDGADPFTEMYLMRTIDQTITIDSSGECTLSTSGNQPGDCFYAQYFGRTNAENPETGDFDIPVYVPTPAFDQTGRTSEHTGSCVVSGDSITLKSVLAYGDLELEDV